MKHLTSIMTNVTDNGKDASFFFSRLASWKIKRSFPRYYRKCAQFFFSSNGDRQKNEARFPSSIEFSPLLFYFCFYVCCIIRAMLGFWIQEGWSVPKLVKYYFYKWKKVFPTLTLRIPFHNWAQLLMYCGNDLSIFQKR